MLTDILERKHTVKRLFERVHILTQKVCSLLESEADFFLWLDYRMEERLTIDDPIERLAYVLSLFTLDHNQKAKTVIFCPGFIAASPRLYQAIVLLNEAKKDFQQEMVGVRKSLLTIKEATLDNQFGNPSHERPEVVHQFLTDIGLEHLHFKHVYRCLPTLSFNPKQLAWTWAHTQSIKTISIPQGVFLLEQKNKEGRFDEDIQKLRSLPPKTYLSIRQKLAPHLRVNIVNEEGKRSMLKGTLPIVFPRSNKLPTIRPAREVSSTGDVPRTARRDKKTDEHAFIPAIRAYIDKESMMQLQGAQQEEALD